ncbi:MAG TPA: hypothetical protein VGD60_11805 [Candidatus Acidoferrales bacterium]
MLEFDLPFPHSYEVEELGELPGTGKFDVPVIYLPPPKGRAEHNGLWLKVKAGSGKVWVGVFAFGYTSPPAFCRIISSPDPNRVCVISNGAGYIVSADQPEAWEQIPIIPVLDVRPILEHKFLICSDFTSLAAYGSSGLVWRSPRVCWDGLKISKITSETIEGAGYDPTNPLTHESLFAVDLKTGRSLLPAPESVGGEAVW